MAGKHSKQFLKNNGISAFELLGGGEKSLKRSTPLALKITATVIVVSLVLSMCFISSYFFGGKIHNNLLENAKTVFNSYSNKSDALGKLSQSNADIKGWITVNGTDIDCAVCQTDNNTYYAKHNQLGKSSRYGALYLSADDSFERAGSDQNIVIYGNNMKNGSMFGTLKKYRNLNFYKQNSKIDIYYKNSQETYMVFAVMILDFDDSDNLDFSKSSFSGEKDFDKWYSEIAERSLINTTVTPKSDDNFLTLVTSAKDFDGAKLVVMAKQINDWQAEHISVSGATVNGNIKYPEKWYKK